MVNAELQIGLSRAGELWPDGPSRQLLNKLASQHARLESDLREFLPKHGVSPANERKSVPRSILDFSHLRQLDEPFLLRAIERAEQYVLGKYQAATSRLSSQVSGVAQEEMVAASALLRRHSATVRVTQIRLELDRVSRS